MRNGQIYSNSVGKKFMRNSQTNPSSHSLTKRNENNFHLFSLHQEKISEETTLQTKCKYVSEKFFGMENFLWLGNICFRTEI